MATSKDKTPATSLPAYEKSGTGAARADDPFDFAPGWRPEPGSTVTGEVVSVDLGENKWGSYPIVTVVQDDGEKIAIHGFHTVLRNALERARPMPGARMAVRYVGLVTEDKKGKALETDYHGYQVRMLDQTADDVWGKRSGDTTPASDFNDEPNF